MPIDPGMLLTALALGLAYAAVPGAVNTEALRRGLAGGFRPAALVETGAIVGDTAWAVVGLGGAAALARFDAVTLALGLVGGGFLLALARSAFLAALRGGQPGDAAPPRDGSSLAVGLMFGLANPAGIAFWAGIGGGVVAVSGPGSLGRAVAFLAAFALGNAVWAVGLAAAVGWGRHRVDRRLFRWVDAACGVALGWFGVRLPLGALRRLAPLLGLARGAV